MTRIVAAGARVAVAALVTSVVILSMLTLFRTPQSNDNSSVLRAPEGRVHADTSQTYTVTVLNDLTRDVRLDAWVWQDYTATLQTVSSVQAGTSADVTVPQGGGVYVFTGTPLAVDEGYDPVPIDTVVSEEDLLTRNLYVRLVADYGRSEVFEFSQADFPEPATPCAPGDPTCPTPCAASAIATPCP